MANLGVLGAIGGLGKGLISEAEEARARERAAIDEARQLRLEKIRAKYRTDENIRSETAAVTEQQRREGVAAEVAATARGAEVAERKRREGVTKTEAATATLRQP